MSHLLDERLGVEPISVQKGGVTSYILWPMNASMPDDVIIRVLRYAGERPFVCARSCPSREMPDSTVSFAFLPQGSGRLDINFREGGVFSRDD